MGIPESDELMLRLEASEGKDYVVTATGPDRAVAKGRFTRPVSDLELDNFILRVARPRVVRSARGSEAQDAKELGGEIFERLLCDDVAAIYHGARKVADSKGRALRITLSMTEAPELLEIPWELLYDRADESFLSDSIFTPVVRTLDLPNPPAARPVTLPFKVLGVVSSPSGFPELDTEAERLKLETALATLIRNRAVELEWLDSATLTALSARVAAPDDLHVIHYIGHGAYNKRTRSGILALEDGRGEPHEVSGEQVARCLKDEKSLRLVVLNSCEGARTSHVDPFSGVATSLLRRGLPAVVGMQAEITDEAAIAFSDRLYTALAQGFPIDAAVAQARVAIAAAGRDIEFGTPVLFMRVTDGLIFDMTDVLPAPAPGRIEAELRAEPEAILAGGAVTWHLKIRNAGGSRISGVIARDRGDEIRAGPLQLEPDGVHAVRWTEVVESVIEERVTIEGRDVDGQALSEGAAARVGVKRRSWWPPSRAALIAGGVVVVALLALAVILLPDGEDGRVDARVYPVDTFATDVDARGDKVAFQASAGADVTEIRQLDLDSGKWNTLVGAKQHEGLDVGLNDGGASQLVYSECEQQRACDIWRASWSGKANRVPASTPECSEIRPSLWRGFLLFASGGPNCAHGLRLWNPNTRESKPIAGDTRGADLNKGVVAWLDMDHTLVAKRLDLQGNLTPAGKLTPDGDYTFVPPIVVDGDYVYFVHSGPQTFIAQARIPLGSSEIRHYSPGKGVPGAEERPHYGVTGDDFFTTNYPQPDGKPGSKKIVWVRNPTFEPAD